MSSKQKIKLLCIYDDFIILEITAALEIDPMGGLSIINPVCIVSL